MTQNEFGDWVEDGNLDKSDMWNLVDELLQPEPKDKTDISNKEV